MIIKDIKIGYPIHILNRDTLCLKHCKVIGVSLPHIDAKSGLSSMVVDVTINDGDINATYSLPENSEVAYNNNSIITPNNECLIREIEAIKNQIENVLDSVDIQRSNLAKCGELLKEVNPTYRDKAAIDERLNNVETSINDVKEMLNKILNKTDA